MTVSSSHRRHCFLLPLVIAGSICPVLSIGFANPQAQGMLERNQERLIKEHQSHKHFAKPESAKGETSEKAVSKKSKEYYEGMVTRALQEEDPRRVAGDALLAPTVKFVGSVSVLIAALLLVFLMSNGLLL